MALTYTSYSLSPTLCISLGNVHEGAGALGRHIIYIYIYIYS